MVPTCGIMNHMKTLSKAESGPGLQTAARAIAELKQYQEPKRIPILSSFFKTGKGQYGEGDTFVGITVPHIRIVAKRCMDMPLAEIEKLLMSKVHEYRSCAAYALDYICAKLDKDFMSDAARGIAMARGTEKRGGTMRPSDRTRHRASRKRIFNFYLSHSSRINNWDLVDASAKNVIGGYLFHHERMDSALKILARLARSGIPAHHREAGSDVTVRNSGLSGLWERRIAIIATFYYTANGKGKDWFVPTVAMAEMLLRDRHDLMHKAVGWMLREVGKRDPRPLHAFLKAHARVMPRTTLRYAIERMSPAERAKYMAR